MGINNARLAALMTVQLETETEVEMGQGRAYDCILASIPTPKQLYPKLHLRDPTFSKNK